MMLENMVVVVVVVVVVVYLVGKVVRSRKTGGFCSSCSATCPYRTHCPSGEEDGK